MLKYLFKAYVKGFIGFISNLYFYPFHKSITKSNIPFTNVKFGRNIFIDKNVAIKTFTLNSELEIGNNVNIGADCTVHADFIGRYTYISRNCDIYARRIGSFCSIAANVGINQLQHPLDYVSTHGYFHKPKYGNIKKNSIHRSDITIGEDVWIGRGVYISGNLNIGTGAVIGAGAVVTKDVPPYAVVVGIPARVIRFRFNQETIDLLLKSRWWEWPEEKLKINLELFSNPNTFLNKFSKTETLINV